MDDCRSDRLEDGKMERTIKAKNSPRKHNMFGQLRGSDPKAEVTSLSTRFLKNTKCEVLE
jgi:hypothetical protein